MAEVRVPRSQVQPGDWAWHEANLDPRKVVRVEGRWIWIEILQPGVEHGPFDKIHYTFTRR